MKKPVIDYSGFRLSKLNNPEYSHLKLLFGWVVYLTFYFLTENIIPAESCHIIYCKLDSIIPFCEWFVIPYTFWYLLIVFSLVYFALYNVESFKKLQTYIIITQIIAIIVYIIYPSCQNLRPAEFPRDNFLTDCIGLIYSFDTNTGVCPSLHCAYSIGIASVWLKEKGISKYWKIFITITVILICLSTMFIKQHSVIDFFAALPVCLVAEVLVFKIIYRTNNNGE